MIVPGGGALPGGMPNPAGMPTGGLISGSSYETNINRIINNTTNNNARIIEVPYVASTNVAGKDIKLVLTRVNKSDTFRSGDV